MTQPPQGPTPAGYYPDHEGTLRWWDGTQWTEHVQPSPTNEAPRGVRVGRLIGGIVLLFLVLVSLSQRAADPEPFASGAEAFGYLLVPLLMGVGGVWLLISAFRRR